MDLMKISNEVITWEKTREIIETNALGDLYRNYSQTEKYHQFKNDIAKDGIDIVSYIIDRRLKWVKDDGTRDLVAKGSYLFTSPQDVRIITNDFPYNFEQDVTHLCAWTKLPIESDPDSDIGDVTDATRAVINRYVQLNFVETLNIDPDNVLWFRNFPALQSVRALSHIHILIKGMPKSHFDQIVDTTGSLLTVAEVKTLLNER